MISWQAPQIYLHREPVDFRKAINGLSMIVEQGMSLSPFADALFVFCNKRCDKLKALYWGATVFCLWHKRLEKDKFHWPRRHADEVFEVSAEQFEWLLRGYDVERMQAQYYRRFVKPTADIINDKSREY